MRPPTMPLGWLAVVACVLATCAAATAGTVYVNGTTGNDTWSGRCQTWDGATCGPKLTIQAGVSAAVAGDTVLVADGTYTGAGNKDLDFGGKAITVRSASGDPAACIIDCQGSGRGFYFHSGETTAAAVRGLTIRNGYVRASSPGGAHGGGLYCSAASPALGNCTVTANTADFGGGVSCSSSANPTLTDCTISGNAVSGSYPHGGGLYCASSSPTLIHCTISGNATPNAYDCAGGGVYCTSYSSPRLANCTISDNYAGDGGGLYCDSNSNPALTDCALAKNAAGGGGGGLYCTGDTCTPTLNNCAISGNTVYSGGGPARGGGVYCGYPSSPALTNCTISDNTATAARSDAYGGGVYCKAPGLTLTDCTISGNRVSSNSSSSAYAYGGGVYFESSGRATNCTISENTSSTSGGGVYCYACSPTLDSCIVSGNSGGFGGGVVCRSSNATMTNCVISANTSTAEGGGVGCLSMSSPKVTNCTVSRNTSGAGGGMYCATNSNPSVTNSIFWGDTPQEMYVASSTPVVTYCNVQGGYAGTGNVNVEPGFAFADDFHLMAGSPCIDAGTNTPTSGLPAQDADGNPRALDRSGDSVAIADIGAYEFNPAAPAIACSPSYIEFVIPAGQHVPQTQTLSIRNAGGGVLNWMLSWNAGWLHVDTVQGESAGEPDTVRLTADASGLSLGVHSATLTVLAVQASNAPRFVEVALYVTGRLRVPDDYPTIQAAIDAAVPGDEVVVADGVYAGVGNKDLDFRGKPITVRSASGRAEACIIDCQGNGRGFYFHSGETAAAVVSGFTIRNGYVTTYSVGSWYGGGVYCGFSSPTLIGCIIAANTSRPSVAGAAGGGGGVYCDRCSPTLINCTIVGNAVLSVVLNTPVYGGGVYCYEASSATLINCTISGNTAFSQPSVTAFGGGIYCPSSSSVRLTNCILWGNRPDEVHGTAAVTYCDVQGGYTGAGNISVDPGFADAGEYRPSAGSPCIDGGTNTPVGGLPSQDADGNPRSLDGNGDGVALADIGAYEFDPRLPLIALNPIRVEFFAREGQASPGSQALSIRNAGGGTLSWTLGWSAGWLEADVLQGESTGEANAVVLAADPGTFSHGTYSTMVTVSDPQARNNPRVVQVVLFVNKALHVPSEYATIQAGIDAAVPGDEVLVADGAYTGAGNRDLDFHGKAVTVRSVGGHAEACIIDCQRAGRGFYFHTGETPAATVSGFTIRNGVHASGDPGPSVGSGVYCYYSSPTLSNCIISGNSATYGAGVCCYSYSSPTVAGCTITGNSAAYGGGLYCYSGSDPAVGDCAISANSALTGAGVYCAGATATLSNCTISGNTASATGRYVYGGGVYCDAGTRALLSNCTITGNTASSDISSAGGGIGCANSASPALVNCVISGNEGGDGGGGVYCDSSASPALTDCLISDNTASYGGAVNSTNSAIPTLTNCIICRNSASSNGGAVSCGASSPTLTNCALSANTALSRGGALYCSGGSPRLTNCILWADGPQEIFVGSGTPVVRYSDLQGGYTGVGNLNLDPLFVNAAGGDYHLGPLSPCIDAGDPAYDFSLEPEPDGGRINMGAYGNTPEAETKGWIYIDGYHIARKTRVGRTVFQYDLTTTVRNASSQGVTNLVATLLAAPTNVQVIDAIVNVGSLPAGSTIESSDTFTIRVDRTTLVSPLPISWRVTYSYTFTEFTTLLDLAPPRLPGDANCDGRVDFDDINPFVLALTGAEGYYDEYPECDWLNADCNGDGLVDFDDINPFVNCLVAGGCP